MTSTDERVHRPVISPENLIVALGTAVATVTFGVADSFWWRVGPPLGLMILLRFGQRELDRRRGRAATSKPNIVVTVATVLVFVVALSLGQALGYDDSPVRILYWIVGAVAAFGPVAILAVRRR